MSSLLKQSTKVKALPPIIQIDGSYKEGGGQILRNAITYAVLLQKSVTISNIRANRPRSPGVRPQHLTGMKLAVEIGNACIGHNEGGAGGGELVGAEVGAKTVSYVYQYINISDDDDAITSNDNDKGCDSDSSSRTVFVANTGTAGSIALLLQAGFLPGLVRAMRHTPSNRNSSVKIELHGGTNATGAPQMDFITDVFAPFINSYFQQHSGDYSAEQPLDIQIIKRGYYPKGGGIVHVNLHPPTLSRASPSTFPPIQLTKCAPIASIAIKVFHAGKCPSWVADKIVRGATNELKRAWRENPRFRKRFLSVGEEAGNSSEESSNSMPMVSIINDADVKITHETNCLGSGSGILIVAYPKNDGGHKQQILPCPALASSGLGDRKVSPLQTGINAAQELIECIASGGCVDRWMQDQIIPFMALADGNQQSEVLTGELTLHSQTAMKVAEQMTGCKFDVERLDCDDGNGGGGDDGEGKQGCYGETGRILGRHIIRCYGIGYQW